MSITDNDAQYLESKQRSGNQRFRSQQTSAILACLSFIVLGLGYVIWFLNPPENVRTILTAGMATCSALVVGLWLIATLFAKFKNIASERDIFRSLNKHLAEIEPLIDDLTMALAYVDKELIRRLSITSRENMELINSARQIVLALQSRYQEICKALSSGDVSDLYMASEIATSPLTFSSNPHVAVIGQTAIQPIPIEDWKCTVAMIVREIHNIEIEDAA